MILNAWFNTYVYKVKNILKILNFKIYYYF